MPFPIEIDRPFLLPSQLDRLARAVLVAHDYDETRWIEWKSSLDLSSQHGLIHIVKQILGFANRDPRTAATWAGGYGYLLVGVSPKGPKGVVKIDPGTLTERLAPYVGTKVNWTPEFITVAEVDVLVVVVEPPRQGDTIHFLRKDLINPTIKNQVVHPEGAIFIRRTGQSVTANEDEREMLMRRATASGHLLDVDVVPRHLEIEAQPKPESLLSDWISKERERLLAARYTPDGAPARPGSLFMTMSRDSRSYEDYAQEVDGYIEDLRRVALERLAIHLANHPAAGLTLALTNNTERPLKGVQVEITVTDPAVSFIDSQEIEEELPPLPKTPEPLGSPSKYVDSLLINSLAAMPFHRAVSLGPAWSFKQVGEGFQAQFRAGDLYPHQTIELDRIPLLINLEPGSSVTIQWAAVGSDSNGITSGTEVLTVTASSFTTRKAMFSKQD
jgi:hypothetical protein